MRVYTLLEALQIILGSTRDGGARESVALIQCATAWHIRVDDLTGAMSLCECAHV